MKNIPIIAFSAYSGTGKTTLLKQLIPWFSSQGMNISILKHAHHSFDIDIPGKDSFELRKAGATQTMIISDKRLAKVTELANPLTFEESLSHIDKDNTDILFVEGFKNGAIKKIELIRLSVIKKYHLKPIYFSNHNVLAVAAPKAEWSEIQAWAEKSTDLSRQDIDFIDLDDIASVGQYLIQHLHQFDTLS